MFLLALDAALCAMLAAASAHLPGTQGTGAGAPVDLRTPTAHVTAHPRHPVHLHGAAAAADTAPYGEDFLPRGRRTSSRAAEFLLFRQTQFRLLVLLAISLPVGYDLEHGIAVPATNAHGAHSAFQGPNLPMEHVTPLDDPFCQADPHLLEGRREDRIVLQQALRLIEEVPTTLTLGLLLPRGEVAQVLHCEKAGPGLALVLCKAPIPTQVEDDLTIDAGLLLCLSQGALLERAVIGVALEFPRWNCKGLWLVPSGDQEHLRLRLVCAAPEHHATCSELPPHAAAGGGGVCEPAKRVDPNLAGLG
mmetsp:Transcript_63701/g.136936  ORF Transcript_63701/g.136936 Transcript_63701/m.136936 type:complete len:305 (+) Transcript_63701:1119-2033(+)